MSIFDRLDRPLLRLSSSVSSFFTFCTACCRFEDDEDEDEGNSVVERPRDDETEVQDQSVWYGYRERIFSNESSIPSPSSMGSSNPHSTALEGLVNPSSRFLELPMESPRELAQAMTDYRRRFREGVQLRYLEEKSRTFGLVVETQAQQLGLDTEFVPTTQAPKLENLSPTTVALADDVRDYWIVVRAMGIER